MKKNQKGFSVVEVIVVLAILGLIGFAGWFVYKNNQKDNPKPSAAQSSATQSNTKPSVDETADWVSLTSRKNGFSMRVPDGWSAINEGASDSVRISSVTYKPGAKATITVTDSQLMGDASFKTNKVIVGIHQDIPPYVSWKSQDGISVAKIDTFKIGALGGDRYSVTWLKDDEFKSYYNGDVYYMYVAKIPGSKVLEINYNVSKDGDTDQLPLVEKFIRTIKVN